jgi:glycosyltransferase involved in cell wall biosynthesis
MACAAPVVAPAGRPYSEYAHGLTFDVDPRDPESIADGLRRAVASGSQRVAAQRARELSWERAVRAHVELYRDLAS